MKAGSSPEICSGTYFPRRGKPQRGYYVLLNEIVVAGPFKSRQGAEGHLDQMVEGQLAEAMEPQAASPLPPAYEKSISTVLREQEKALATMQRST